MKPLVFLAPVGALLYLACASLTLHGVLIEIASLLESSYQVQFPVLKHLVGVAGLLLFGLGNLAALLWLRGNATADRPMLASAVFAMVSACLLIGYGNYNYYDAFRRLATAESVEPEFLLQDTALGKIPTIAGASCLLAAALLLVPGSLRGKSKIAPGKSALFILGVGTFVLAFAAIDSTRALAALQGGLSGEYIEPAAIAYDIVVLSRTTFLLVFVVAAIAMAWTAGLISRAELRSVGADGSVDSVGSE